MSWCRRLRTGSLRLRLTNPLGVLTCRGGQPLHHRRSCRHGALHHILRELEALVMEYPHRVQEMSPESDVLMVAGRNSVPRALRCILREWERLGKGQLWQSQATESVSSPSSGTSPARPSGHTAQGDGPG